jgi:hypothetical protein
MVMKCNICGSEIFPEEIYYTLCMHIEKQESTTENISIIDMKPLEFRCKLCAERGIVVC